MTSTPPAPRSAASADGQGRAYAVGEALRRLATQTHRFTLRSADAPQLQLQLDIEPLPAPPGAVVRYRRTLSTLRHGQPAGRLSSIVELDLPARRVVAVQFEGVRSEVRRAEPLPASARIGEAGHWFDQVAAVDAQPQRPAAATSTSTSMSWSLEPWDADGQALWCTHVRAADGRGIDSAEGFAITPDGALVGAAIRGWTQAPSRDGARVTDGGDPPAGRLVRRLMEMRTG